MPVRNPTGSFAAMHMAVIEQAAEMQLRAFAEIAQQYATELSPSQLSFEEGVRFTDLAEIIDGAKTDPATKEQLDGILREQLIPAIQQVFQPPQQQEGAL